MAAALPREIWLGTENLWVARRLETRRVVVLVNDVTDVGSATCASVEITPTPTQHAR
jgi:hypothetical protein